MHIHFSIISNDQIELQFASRDIDFNEEIDDFAFIIANELKANDSIAHFIIRAIDCDFNSHFIDSYFASREIELRIAQMR